MKKRVINLLIVGGVAVLCIAPRNVSAEENNAVTIIRPDGTRLINNMIPQPVIQETLLTVPEPQPASLRTETQMPQDYRGMVNKYSKDNGVDPDLIDAMMKTESNYDRRAVSPKGAKGLMQLMPETGRRFGVQDFFDPRQNIEGGVKYMKFLLDMFGNNVSLSLAAYNAGENLVARIKDIPPIPETRNYVKKILADYKKPSTVALEAKAKIEPTKQGVSVSPQSDVASADKVEESAPISKWLDERGVIHYSNIGPPN